MPIRDLVEQQDGRSEWPRIAKLRKGEPKRRAASGKETVGRDTDYFRADFEGEYQHLAELFTRMYGAKPKAFDWCYVDAETPEQALDYWMESYRTDETLLHRCDGQFQHRWFDENTGRYSRAQIACTAPDISQTKDTCGCKQVGRLNLILKGFIEESGVPGYVTVETHSMEDIRTLLNYLRAIHKAFGTLRGVPFRFGRVAKRTTAPELKDNKRTGKRMRITRSLFFIHVMPEFTKTRLLPVLAGEIQRPTAASQVPALPVPTGNLLRESYGGPRRLVTPEADGNGNGHKDAGPAYNEARWQKFLDRAKERFGMDYDVVWAALDTSSGVVLDSLDDWQGTPEQAVAALVAMHCDYDIERIDKFTGSSSMYSIDQRDYAIEIAKHVIAQKNGE